MEAARRAPSLDKEIRRPEERRVASSGFPKDPLKRFQDVNLKPEEAFVLSRVDGTQTAKDIFTLSPLSEEMTARTLVGLLKAELIEPDGDEALEGEGAPDEGADRRGRREARRRPRSRPAPDADAERAEVERLFQEFPSRNHWEVLEIPQGSGLDEIQQAFFRGAKRFHPDRFRRIPAPDFQEKLSYVFRRFTEANEILTSSARAGYEALADKEGLYEASRKSSFPSRGGGAGRSGGRRGGGDVSFPPRAAGLRGFRFLERDPALPPSDRPGSGARGGLPPPRSRAVEESQVAPGRGEEPPHRDEPRSVESRLLPRARKPLPGGWAALTGAKGVRASESGRSDSESARTSSLRFADGGRADRLGADRREGSFSYCLSLRQRVAVVMPSRFAVFLRLPPHSARTSRMYSFSSSAQAQERPCARDR